MFLKKSASPLRTLVVDDDPWFRAFVRSLLEERGAIVWEAQSAIDARQILDATHIDLAMVDLLMPGISGLNLVAEARQSFPDLKILAVSGVATEDGFLRSARVLGADAALEKPFNGPRLKQTLSRIFP